MSFYNLFLRSKIKDEFNEFFNHAGERDLKKKSESGLVSNMDESGGTRYYVSVETY